MKPILIAALITLILVQSLECYGLYKLEETDKFYHRIKWNVVFIFLVTCLILF